jgi:hypothetical protein
LLGDVVVHEPTNIGCALLALYQAGYVETGTAGLETAAWFIRRQIAVVEAGAL